MEGPAAGLDLDRPAQEGSLPTDPAKAPAEVPKKKQKPTRASPPEEKPDCDDCVIVRHFGEAGNARETAGAGASGALAGTLWGLFLVTRPRRVPRTIIRGVTVP